MTTDQPTARAASPPAAVPSSRPRTVSIIGVNGWWAANQPRTPVIESVGTNPLPRNGSSIRGIGRLLALSTLLETIPSGCRRHGRSGRPRGRSTSSGSG
jgi:hypothetical protein